MQLGCRGPQGLLGIWKPENPALVGPLQGASPKPWGSISVPGTPSRGTPVWNDPQPAGTGQWPLLWGWPRVAIVEVRLPVLLPRQWSARVVTFEEGGQECGWWPRRVRDQGLREATAPVTGCWPAGGQCPPAGTGSGAGRTAHGRAAGPSNPIALSGASPGAPRLLSSSPSSFLVSCLPLGFRFLGAGSTVWDRGWASCRCPVPSPTAPRARPGLGEQSSQPFSRHTLAPSTPGTGPPPSVGTPCHGSDRPLPIGLGGGAASSSPKEG